jgi:hypothetical protein
VKGRFLSKIKLDKKVTSVYFSACDNYLALQFQDSIHSCISFRQLLWPHNLNWKQSLHISFMMDHDVSASTVYENDYLLLPEELVDYLNKMFTQTNYLIMVRQKLILFTRSF